MEGNRDQRTAIGFDSDWRKSVSLGLRKQQLEKIIDCFKTCFPTCFTMGYRELMGLMAWFEDDMFCNAKNELDYLENVSLKLRRLERRLPAYLSKMPPPSMNSLTQSSMPNAAGQRINMQSRIVNQGGPSYISSNTQQQLQLQQFSSQQQQQQLQFQQFSSQQQQQQQLQFQQFSSQQQQQQQQQQFQQFSSQLQRLQSPNSWLFEKLQLERQLNHWLQFWYDVLREENQHLKQILQGSIQQQPLQQPQNSNRPLITASAQQQFQQSGSHWSSMQPQQQQQERQQQQQPTTTATTTATTAIATAGQQQTTTETAGRQKEMNHQRYD